MRFLVSIAFFWKTLFVLSQPGIAPLSDQDAIPLRSEFTLRQHTAIKPANRYLSPADTTGKMVMKDEIVNPRIFLVPDAAFQYDTNFYQRLAAGAGIEGVKKTWYYRASYTAGWSSREGINQTHPGILPWHNHKNYIYTDIRARVGYTPNKTLHLSAGIDNNFFGEGYRSLVQGDQVAPNPFALMRVNFWRLEYGLLYQLFHGNNGQVRQAKFSATHYLSYNVTHHWNIGVIENVLFQAKDSVFRRGFELEYLNPIVFFRPQEYSLGSSDNVLLALQSSYTFNRQCIYTQVALDEFDLTQIKNRTRWWANKYAVQLGVKGDLSAKMSYRLEANVARPYTYSHIGAGQNVANLGRPLAHPQGGNFAELLAIWNLKNQLWHWKAYGSFLLKGYDENGFSMGGDVNQNYNHRPPKPDDLGHRIGQGVTVRTVFFGAELAHILPQMAGRIYLNPQISMQWGDKGTSLTPMVTAGFRTSLFQERKLF